jgi:hypothetical protein
LGYPHLGQSFSPDASNSNSHPHSEHTAVFIFLHLSVWASHPTSPHCQP